MHYFKIYMIIHAVFVYLSYLLHLLSITLLTYKPNFTN